MTCKCCDVTGTQARTWVLYDSTGALQESGQWDYANPLVPSSWGTLYFCWISDGRDRVVAGTQLSGLGGVGFNQWGYSGSGVSAWVWMNDTWTGSNRIVNFPAPAGPYVYGGHITKGTDYIDEDTVFSFAHYPAVRLSETQRIQTFGTPTSAAQLVYVRRYATDVGLGAYNSDGSLIYPASQLVKVSGTTLYAGLSYSSSTATNRIELRNFLATLNGVNVRQACLHIPNSLNLKGANIEVIGDGTGIARAKSVTQMKYVFLQDVSGPTRLYNSLIHTNELAPAAPGPYNLRDFENTQRVTRGGNYTYVTNGMEDPTKYNNAYQGLSQYAGAFFTAAAGAPGTPYFALAADTTHVFASYYSGGTGKVERRAHASFSTVDWTYNRGAARVKCLAVDSSGNVYWGGEVSAGVSYGKLNSSGVSQWTGNHGATVHGIAVDGSGNVYIAGEEDGSGSHYTLRKLNSAGTLQWSQSHYGTDYSGASSGAFYDVDVTTDGSRIIACGKTVEY